jgi:hypothetical protein
MSFNKIYWIFTLSFECENKTPCFVRIARMDTQGKKKKTMDQGSLPES